MKVQQTYLWDVHYQIEGAPLRGSMKVASLSSIEAMAIAKTQVHEESLYLKKRKRIKAIPKVEVTAAFNIGIVTVKYETGFQIKGRKT